MFASVLTEFLQALEGLVQEFYDKHIKTISDKFIALAGGYRGQFCAAFYLPEIQLTLIRSP